MSKYLLYKIRSMQRTVRRLTIATMRQLKYPLILRHWEKSALLMMVLLKWLGIWSKISLRDALIRFYLKYLKSITLKL